GDVSGQQVELVVQRLDQPVDAFVRSGVTSAHRAARPIPALSKIIALYMHAASRTSTAMSSSRCGWISMPRLPRWAAVRPKPPDTTAFRRKTHVYHYPLSLVRRQSRR